MGKRGPAPKPKALKVLAGTDRPDREAPNAPRVEPGIPELPDGWAEESDWGGYAVEEYNRMAVWLKDAGLLSKVDRAAFLGYCDSWGKWRYYRRLVKEHGDTVTTAQGTITRSPYAIQEEKSKAEVKRWLALFGLSPSDRTRVTSLAGEPQVRNPFEEFTG